MSSRPTTSEADWGTAPSRRLVGVLEEVLAPMRVRRAQFAADPGAVRALVAEGTTIAHDVTGRVLADVRRAFALDA